MKLFAFVLVGFAFISNSAFAADYNILCRPDGSSKYLVELRSPGFWANKATVNLIEKSSKEVVATYTGTFDKKQSHYVFGDKNQFSFYYDEDNSVGMDEGGPFDITLIWGYVTMEAVSGPVHCDYAN